MTTDKTGGPAFPYSALEPDPTVRGLVGSMYAESKGMTMRDYFAGQAMATLALMFAEINFDQMDGKEFPARVADGAYEIADAMLAKREKP